MLRYVGAALCSYIGCPLQEDKQIAQVFPSNSAAARHRYPAELQRVFGVRGGYQDLLHVLPGVDCAVPLRIW